MTDVSVTVMSLLMAVGLLLVALKPVPLPTGRAFIYAGIAILCAHAIGLRIVAPVKEATAETVGWITLFLMIGMIAFLAGRGLVRTVQKNKSASSELAN
jgi:uncharacterized membrane protein YgdD (TMEM256/DUF423 family)